LTVTVSGSLGSTENGCNRIALVCTGTGCSYGDDQPGSAGWSGPFLVGGYHNAGSAGDDPFYAPVPGDGKIAPHGLPALICSQNDPPILTPPGFRGGPVPAGIGIGRNARQFSHAGTQTLAVMAGSACSATNSGGLGCPDLDGPGSPLLWGALEDPGFGNLLRRISTDDAGNVVSAPGYGTQELSISACGAPPGDSSWAGGTLSFAAATVVPVPAAASLLVAAGIALTPPRRRTNRH
jgi:hypothetical protein